MTFNGFRIDSIASANNNGGVVNVKSVDMKIISTKRMKIYAPLSNPNLVRLKKPHCQ